MDKILEGMGDRLDGETADATPGRPAVFLTGKTGEHKTEGESPRENVCLQEQDSLSKGERT